MAKAITTWWAFCLDKFKIMKYCINCGTKLLDKVNFCSFCGEKNNKQDNQIPEELKENNKTPLNNLDNKTEPEVNKETKSIEFNKLDSFIISALDLEKYSEEEDIIKSRKCEVSEEYIEHIKTKTEKDIAYTVCNYQTFATRKPSSLFFKNRNKDKDFQELVKKEKEECGDIISSHPVDQGVVFVTEKGICPINFDSVGFPPGVIGAVSGASALSIFGPVGAALGAGVGGYVGRRLEDRTYKKYRSFITNSAKKYSPCLTARSINSISTQDNFSMFIPYKLINLLVYNKENGRIDIHFCNDSSWSFVITDNEEFLEFIKNISKYA